MIIGIAWKDVYSDVKKDKIIVQFENAGFRWADTDEEDPHGDRKTAFVGDDMLILDVDEQEMWTGDWGTYVDLEVSLDFARKLNERFDT